MIRESHEKRGCSRDDSAIRESHEKQGCSRDDSTRQESHEKADCSRDRHNSLRRGRHEKAINVEPR